MSNVCTLVQMKNAFFYSTFLLLAFLCWGGEKLIIKRRASKLSEMRWDIGAHQRDHRSRAYMSIIAYTIFAMPHHLWRRRLTRLMFCAKRWERRVENMKIIQCRLHRQCGEWRGRHYAKGWRRRRKVSSNVLSCVMTRQVSFSHNGKGWN